MFFFDSLLWLLTDVPFIRTEAEETANNTGTSVFENANSEIQDKTEDYASDEEPVSKRTR